MTPIAHPSPTHHFLLLLRACTLRQFLLGKGLGSQLALLGQPLSVHFLLLRRVGLLASSSSSG